MFTLKDVKSRCGSAPYRRGEDYYRRGKVTHLECAQDGLAYKARVKGSKSYKVEFSLWEDDIDTQCNCPAYDSYDRYCKHIAAVLIAIHDQDAAQAGAGTASEIWSIQDQFLEWLAAGMSSQNRSSIARQTPRLTVAEKEAAKYKATDLLIDQHRGSQLDESRCASDSGLNKELLKFEYTFRLDYADNYYSQDRDRLLLEMRMGVKRLYVVQKLKSLLASVEQKQEYVFTPNFAYDPAKHEISEQDQAVLHLLIQMKIMIMLIANIMWG